jgi:hypothetical protein
LPARLKTFTALTSFLIYVLFGYTWGEYPGFQRHREPLNLQRDLDLSKLDFLSKYNGLGRLMSSLKNLQSRERVTMFALRSTTSLLGAVCHDVSKNVCRRNFHALPRGKMPTPRSPRLSARPHPGIVRLKKTYDVEESLPPTILLNSAHTAGLLSIPSDKALHFLRVYHDISRRSMTGWEQKVCKGTS